MLIDTHAHLDDRKYDLDRQAVLLRAQEAGVRTIINVGYDFRSSLASIELAHHYDFIYAAVGYHPHDAKDYNDEVELQLRQWCLTEPRVVAIGEIGLDYYWDNSPRHTQQEVFERQIALAKAVHKPIIVHDRDAHGDVMEILKKEQARDVGGVLHCFSGSWEMAKLCLALGFYISFAGPVTFQNAPKLREIAKQVPADRILVETDSPYLSPHPYRGQRNESAHVRLVADTIAAVRGLTFEELAAQTSDNAKRLFGLS